MNKIKFLFIILFLLRLQNSSWKYYILFYYYLILVYGLFFKGNMLNDKKTPKNINNLWIQYYYYDTLYYLYSFYFNTNYRRYSAGKIVHHLITLNFFLRKRYNSRALNFIHGNIILSGVPGHSISMINKTRFSIKGIEERRLIDIYTKAFTFFYLNFFFY